MADLVQLHTGRTAQQEDAIRKLAIALDEARNGDIIAVGIVAVRPGLHANVCFSDCDNSAILLGGAAMLQHRIYENMEVVRDHDEGGRA